MIDYIDDCFDLINFPDFDFIERIRKEFHDIDNLFCFSFPSKHILSKQKKNSEDFYINRYTNINAVHNFWCINIQDMRYDLEIPLMFLMYYYEKGIPQTDNQIEDCYSKYDWSNKDYFFDDNNPSNLEQYKKLFNTFLNFFTSSMIIFSNKIKEHFLELLFLKDKNLFKENSSIKINSEINLSPEILQKTLTFVENFKTFLYKSEFKELRELRNDFIHHTSPTKNEVKANYNKDTDFIEFYFGKDLKTITELVDLIKSSLCLLEHQCNNFKDWCDDYLFYLSNF